MKNILFIIFLVTFTSCVKKEKSHFQFFEQYISFQKSLRKKYLNTGKLSILQGSLSEKQEDQLFKSKDGKLYIAVYSNSPGGSNISETKETEKKSNNHFYLKSQFEYSKFNKTDSYINERYVEYTNLPVLTYKDFFLWFSFLQKNEIEKISSGVPFYTFLCTYFDCNLKETSDYWQISITPNLKLKNLDGVFYTKITNFLEKANLEINVFGKNNLEYAKIFNSKSSYYFYMNKKNLISKNMESLTFKVNIEA
ncbi:MAG: hypothetical protein KDK36_01470, partial [Leptospiraceae bacterium]|nr:hypothetical protein [Leptospiraceae bacterium]